MNEQTTEITTAITTPTKHHDFSPSKLQQLRDCPGSYRMQIGLADTATPEAEEGTMLHDRIARGYFDGLTTEQAELCAACLKTMADIAGGENSGAQIYHEQHLQVHDENGGLLTEGTADVVIVFPDGELAVIDWKFGRNPVKEVNRNLQLAAYCLAAMQKYGCTECTGYIYQPRCYAASEYRFTKPEAILANIKRVIDMAKQQQLVLNAGDACKYCLAKATCPAFREKFAALAAGPAYDLSNPQQLAALYDASKKVEKFCREIKTAMEDYIKANGDCCGWHFKEKPGNRECTDVLALYDAVKDYINPAEYNNVCSVSVGKLVDAIVDKQVAAAKASGEKLTKVAAKANAEQMMATLVQRGMPTATIVQG